MKNKLINTLVLLSLSWALCANTMAEHATFEKVCQSCHTGGFKGWVSGAPNIHKQQEWQTYLKRDSIETMKKIVLEGNDDHKRKGGCSKCSDEDITSALEYMLSKVQ